MHPSALENMHRLWRRYGTARTGAAGSVLELAPQGEAEFEQVFAGSAAAYRSVGSLQAEPGASADLVIAGPALAQGRAPLDCLRDMLRVAGPEGLVFCVLPTAGPGALFPRPVFDGLAMEANAQVVETYQDERGPWRDVSAVFAQRGPNPPRPFDGVDDAAARNIIAIQPPESEDDVIRGALSLHEMLARLHRDLQPSSYLEIGVRTGRSLALAACPAVGVDPAPDVSEPLGPQTRLVTQTSDAFFEAACDPILRTQPDLVFIDGMHHFEFALRDFMNAERHAGPRTLVAIDDVLPNRPRQADRDRSTRVWTGDVWKLIPTLRDLRPDLTLTLLDTSPTGLLLVTGLDPKNRALWDGYNDVVARLGRDGLQPPDEILTRADALSPKVPELGALLARDRDR